MEILSVVGVILVGLWVAEVLIYLVLFKLDRGPVGVSTPPIPVSGAAGAAQGLPMRTRPGSSSALT